MRKNKRMQDKVPASWTKNLDGEPIYNGIPSHSRQPISYSEKLQRREDFHESAMKKVKKARAKIRT